MRRSAVRLFATALAFAGVMLAGPALAATWLGVASQDITPELREGLQYNGSGALVTRVVSDSPAERAGIQRGDVIVSVGAKSVTSPQQLADAVQAMKAGSKTSVVVVREGTKKSLSVTLESHDSDSDDDFVTPPPPDEPMAPRAPRGPRAYSWHAHGDDDGHDFMMHMPDMSDMPGRGRLGVRVQELSPDLAGYFGKSDVKGVLVLEVTKESAAEKAGIRAGDVITHVGTKPIEDSDDLVEAVRSSEGETPVTLLRHGAKQTVKPTLEKAPEVMRYRRGPQGFNWKSDGSHSFRFESPDGHSRHIVIDGDDRESMDSLRVEVNELKDQLEQLRTELKKSNKK